MKKFILCIVANVLTAASGQVAFSADMPVKAPPAAVVVNTWSGCSIGVHGGGLWARKDWTLHNPDEFFGAPLGHNSPDGWLAGGQAGCNHQFDNRVVIGIQGDFAWTNAKDDHVDVFDPSFTDHSKIRWLASVTGRLGYAWDRWLGYVKGGAAWVRDDYAGTSTESGKLLDLAKETRNGWTFGVGVEYAFTSTISGFVEYDHFEFGTHDIAFRAPTGEQSDIIAIWQTVDVVKAGVNAKLWTGH